MVSLKLGIVGYGPRGGSVVDAIGSAMDLVAVFDPGSEAQEKAKKKNLQIAESFEDLISKDIDAIVIGSPPQVHAQQAIDALNTGLHVFSEVPMAIKEEDIQKIIDADENNPRAKYMLGENNCYDPDVLYAAHLVSTGKLGPIVYAEQEYIHDVSYRWRGRNVSNFRNSPIHENWYSQFDPLAYAHTILPAQVTMGGLKNPVKFIETQSYATDIGGQDGIPVCRPAKAFQVGLFKTKDSAICKCAAAYVFARNPTRYTCQVTGRFGNFESEDHGRSARQFIADGFNITRGGRAGKVTKIRNIGKLSKFLKSNGYSLNQNVRTVSEWINAIREDRAPLLGSRTVANSCHAGLMASKAARTGKPQSINTFEE